MTPVFKMRWLGMRIRFNQSWLNPDSRDLWVFFFLLSVNFPHCDTLKLNPSLDTLTHSLTLPIQRTNTEYLGTISINGCYP